MREKNKGGFMLNKVLFDIILSRKCNIDMSFLNDNDILNYYLNLLYGNYDNWNNRLIYYNNLIDSNNITDDHIPNLIKDLSNSFYQKKYNENYELLNENLIKIKDKLARFYNCNNDEICIGNYDGKYKIINNERVCSYKVILGSAYFNEYDITNLGELELILYNAVFEGSNINNMGNLKYIGRNAIFSNFRIFSLNKLKIIGNDAYFDGAVIRDMGDLSLIIGNAYFEYASIPSLKNLKAIGGSADLQNSSIFDLGELIFVGNDLILYYSPLQNTCKLQIVGGNAYLGGSDINSFNNLKIVWNKLYLDYSKTKDLGNINMIGYLSSYNSYEQRNIYDLEFYKDYQLNKKIRKLVI